MSAHGYETPFLWPGDTIEDEAETSNSIFKRVPCMAGYRNNLTALSQTYNVS